MLMRTEQMGIDKNAIRALRITPHKGKPRLGKSFGKGEYKNITELPQSVVMLAMLIYVATAMRKMVLPISRYSVNQHLLLSVCLGQP